MALEIPPIPNKLKLPVQTLARAADLFRGVFIEAVAGRSLEDILAEREQYLLLAEKAINRWRPDHWRV